MHHYVKEKEERDSHDSGSRCQGRALLRLSVYRAQREADSLRLLLSNGGGGGE